MALWALARPFFVLYNRAMDTEAHESPDRQEQHPSPGAESASFLRGNRDLAVLYAIAGLLNRKVDVREMLQEVLTQVTQLFGLQTGWVWLLDRRYRRPEVRELLPAWWRL